MKVRIVSDGTPYGTAVQDPEGRPLSGIKSLTWTVNANEPATALVDMEFLPLQGLAEAKMLGPGGKEVRRIEYADGSIDEFPA